MSCAGICAPYKISRLEPKATFLNSDLYHAMQTEIFVAWGYRVVSIRSVGFGADRVVISSCAWLHKPRLPLVLIKC